MAEREKAHAPVVFLSGRIAGDADYREKFSAAERALRARGYAVLNPAWLPGDMPGDRYMPICLAMLGAADIVCVLEGSDGSPGVAIERRFAEYQGKMIVDGVDGFGIERIGRGRHEAMRAE